MTPEYVSVCVKLMVFLIFVFSTSSTTQCTPKKTERDGYVIKNIGIKISMCELKCVEYGQCLSIEYNLATLTCRLSTDESTKIKKKEGYVIRARDHSHEVMIGACTSSKCSFVEQCLETRSGKAVCVQDEKQNHPEKSAQHKVVKQETSVGGSLHEACVKGHLDRAGYILSQGLVDINSRDKKHGKTPLMVAALQRNIGMFVFLTNKGDNISVVGNGCKNTLCWACKKAARFRFNCELKQCNIKTNVEETPFLLQYSFSIDKYPYDVLLCMGAKVVGHYRGMNVLGWACSSGHVGIFRFLLTQRIVDINSRTVFTRTPLMLSIMYGYSDIFYFLIGMGANVSQVDGSSQNLLHLACLFGRLGMVKYLVSNGSIDINGRTKSGMSPLMIAGNNRYRDVFKLLIDMRANVSQADCNGNNILHLASMKGHMQIAKYLFSQNLVDINAKNKHGETAAMLAKRHDNLNIYHLLVSGTQ